VTVVGSLIATSLLMLALANHRHQFSTALSSASLWILAVAVVLQIVALLSRSEAWLGCIEAAGGTVQRRKLFRASAMGSLWSVVNSQLGVAARIGALRRSSPGRCPGVPTLVAAEFPILAVEALLAALTSFTLIGPLGLPWWLPLILLAVVGTLSGGLRHLAQRTGRELWKGLAILRSLRGGWRLLCLVLVAVFCQILRNWLLLHAVGVDISFFNAIAVLIAMVVLSQIPIGPTSGTAATVLVLHHHGVADVAAAGVLTTVTGTIGGLSFAAWSGLDRLWSHIRHPRRRHEARPSSSPA
jgi:uncharacterized membrane protein YbhN (UPF0104 family)